MKGVTRVTQHIIRLGLILQYARRLNPLSYPNWRCAGNSTCQFVAQDEGHCLTFYH